MRRIRQRIDELNRKQAETDSEKTINGVKIVDNVDDNRLQLFFKGKPSEEIRSMLKAHGFRWTPSVGCWQAYRGANANYWAEQIVKKLQ